MARLATTTRAMTKEGRVRKPYLLLCKSCRDARNLMPHHGKRSGLHPGARPHCKSVRSLTIARRRLVLQARPRQRRRAHPVLVCEGRERSHGRSGGLSGDSDTQKPRLPAVCTGDVGSTCGVLVWGRGYRLGTHTINCMGLRARLTRHSRRTQTWRDVCRQPANPRHRGSVGRPNDTRKCPLQRGDGDAWSPAGGGENRARRCNSHEAIEEIHRGVELALMRESMGAAKWLWRGLWRSVGPLLADNLCYTPITLVTPHAAQRLKAGGRKPATRCAMPNKVKWWGGKREMYRSRRCSHITGAPSCKPVNSLAPAFSRPPMRMAIRTSVLRDKLSVAEHMLDLPSECPPPMDSCDRVKPTMPAHGVANE